MIRIAVPLAMFASVALAQDEPAPASDPAADAAAVETPVVAESQAGSSVRTMSGMSILGNEEAPKSLVIVPWKSSKRGDGLDVSNALDDTPRPVDREVFARELHYYHLRTDEAE